MFISNKQRKQLFPHGRLFGISQFVYVYHKVESTKASWR